MWKALAACWSIRTLFVLLAMVHITICASVVGYLGYRNAVDVTSQLSEVVSTERFERVRVAVDGSLKPLLQAAQDLHDWIEPVAPAILQADSVLDIPWFWYYGVRTMSHNLAWKLPFGVSLACAIGNNSLVFSPTEVQSRIFMLISNSPTSSRRSTNGIFTFMPQNRSTFEIMTPNTTFRSMLQQGLLTEVVNIPYLLPTQRSWYTEAVRAYSSPPDVSNFIWTPPFITRDKQLLLGVAVGVAIPGQLQAGGACLAQLPARKLAEAIASIPAGQQALTLLAGSNGRVLASNVAELQPLVVSLDNFTYYLQNSSSTISSAFLQALLPLLYRYNFISATANVVPADDLARSDPAAITVSADIDGRHYLCRMGTLTTPGFGGFVVTCFDKADFDDGAGVLLRDAFFSTGLVLLSALVSTLVLLHFVWRGVDALMGFMRALQQASGTVDSTNPSKTTERAGGDDKQGAHGMSSKSLRVVAKQWEHYVNTGYSSSRSRWATCCFLRRQQVHKLDSTLPRQTTSSQNDCKESRASSSQQLSHDGELGLTVVVESQQAHPLPATASASAQVSSGWLDLQSAAANQTAASAAGSPDELLALSGGNSFAKSPRRDVGCSYLECQLFEPALMRHTFGSMLKSICSYQDEVERANEAKRHFIRYIFHEVRVPFNSVVLCK